MNVLKYILTRSLPKTGQSYVYSAGDDGTYQAGWWRNRSVLTNKTRFKDNGNGTISDKSTGLMWQKIASSEQIIWSDSIITAEALTLAGYTDWRLPNVLELLSIVDWTQYDPCINHTFFPYTLSDIYWSSTTSVSNDVEVHAFDFGSSTLVKSVKNTLLFFRAVRTER